MGQDKRDTGDAKRQVELPIDIGPLRGHEFRQPDRVSDKRGSRPHRQNPEKDRYQLCHRLYHFFIYFDARQVGYQSRGGLVSKSLSGFAIVASCAGGEF